MDIIGYHIFVIYIYIYIYDMCVVCIQLSTVCICLIQIVWPRLCNALPGELKHLPEKVPISGPCRHFQYWRCRVKPLTRTHGWPCFCLALLRLHRCAASKHFLFLSSRSVKPRETFHTLHIVQSISPSKPNRRWLQNTSSKSRVPKLTQLGTL